MEPLARFVALFRGINVGKAKRVAMADLRDLLQTLGYTNVRTLLNSGNAIFDGRAEPQKTHAKRIQAAVASRLGVEALVIVKSARDIAAVVAGNKLGAIATNPSSLLVAFTSDAAALAAVSSLTKAKWSPEVLYVGKHAAYVWCANGILESKVIGALLREIDGAGTTRNWATVGKIHLLCQDVQ